MIPKFRVWNAETKAMYEVKSLVFTLRSMFCVNRKLVYPGRTFYFDDENICLMQSTGLFDKNGVEIFEGDVVLTTRFKGRADVSGGHYEWDKEYKGVVKMLEGCWVIYTGNDLVELWSEIEENEVVGNIHENPDLLESVEE